jgi:hypothetical protein
MKWFNNSVSALFHLAAWLIFLPLLLFLLFKNTPYSSYLLDSQDNKIVLAILVGMVGIINSGILIPRLLYFRKLKFYFLTAFLLVLLSTIFDFTLSSAISPVLSYIESISWSRILALSAALVISTSIRIIHDQNKNEEVIHE